MRDFGPVVRVLGRVMGDQGHDRPMGDAVAAQLVGHETNRFLSLALQESSKESPRRPCRRFNRRAYSGPNFPHHCRMVSYDTKMPRLASKSSAAQAVSMVQPHGVANDGRRKAIPKVAGSSGVHPGIVPRGELT